MFRWLDHLRDRIDAGTSCLLVTLIQVDGSAPQTTGAKLVVDRKGLCGTIGGGNLEFRATAQGRQLLAAGAPKRMVEKIALGPALGQCCGGHVTVAFELIDRTDRPWITSAHALLATGQPGYLVTEFNEGAGGRWVVSEAGDDDAPKRIRQAAQETMVDEPVLLTGQRPIFVERLFDNRPALWLFGAGHVGRAVVDTLADLPLDVTWFDSRADAFPSSVPVNVTARTTINPPAEVTQAPADALYLVLTHSHQLDQEICGAVLRRGDFRYLGLIGSRTKRSRFLARWRAEGLSEAALEGLVCPIGITGLTGKSPKEVAVATVAQILRKLEAPKEKQACRGSAS